MTLVYNDKCHWSWGQESWIQTCVLLFTHCKIPRVLNLLNYSLPIYKMEVMSTSAIALGLDALLTTGGKHPARGP